MKPLLLFITLALLSSVMATVPPPLTFRQTLAKVAREREPGLMVDIYGEYPVTGPAFWAAVLEFLGPDRAVNFPPYAGTPEGAAWRKIYPHCSVYLDSPTVFLHDPDALQRLHIAAFLEAYCKPAP